MINFDVSQLEEKFMRPLAMHVCLSWIWEKFVKKNPKQKKRVVVDEAWMFMRHEATADFLELMARRARKRNCSLCIASQSFAEFYNSDKGQAVMANCPTKVFLKQDDTVLEKVVDVFGLSDGEKAYLRTMITGEALLRVGRETVPIQILAAPEERRFLETNPNDEHFTVNWEVAGNGQ